MKPLIWIIDEEWPDYNIETRLLNEAFPGCEIRYSKNDYAADLEAFGTKADAIICQVYVDLPGATINRLEKCKIISLFGGGYDRIDIAAAKAKGIPVAFVPGYCVEDLSDYVIAAIFHHNKSLVSYAQQVQNGLWGAQAVPKPVNRIRNATLLIIGLGRIGSAVAQKAKALNMNVIAFDPYVGEEAMKSLNVTKVGWEEGLLSADFISINAKLTPETNGLIAYEDLRLMKKRPFLINTARGKIFVESDFVRAAKEGLIAGAVVDVVANEPPDLNSDIFHTDNIWVTPHISYISVQSYEELKIRASQHAIDVLLGKEISDLAL